MSTIRKSQPWGVRTIYRDGVSRLIGPYRGYLRAIEAQVQGGQVISSTAVALPGVRGHLRVLDEKRLIMGVEEVVVPPAPDPQIDANTYGDWYNATDIVAGNWSCPDKATAVAEQGMFVYVTDASPLIDGIRLVGVDEDGAPWQADYTVTADLASFKYGGDDPPAGYFIIGDAALDGKTVQQAGALDSSSALIDGLVPLDFFWPLMATAGLGPNPGDISALILSVVPSPPDRVLVTGDCGAPNPNGELVIYYDPAGPSAGLNPGTFSSTKWDAGGVIFSDSAPTINDISRLQILWDQAGVGGGDGGAFEVMGDPVPAAEVPTITSMSSPANDRVQIDGTSLLIADSFDIGWLPNTPSDYIQVFNPAGPNVGLQNVNVNIITWTNTQVVVEFIGFNGETINNANIYTASLGDPYVSSFSPTPFLVS